MARLINFGAGDIADRLTILSLKIHHGEVAGKDTAHFRHEYAALLTKIRAGNGLAGYLEELLELATVNAAIWTATDVLRVLGEKDLQGSGKVGLQILTLNDRRAALIEAINQKTGEHRGQEKV